MLKYNILFSGNKHSLITSLLHTKISSKAENCVVKVNPRPVNEVSENNLPLTGNLQMQTPNNNKCMNHWKLCGQIEGLYTITDVLLHAMVQ
jgi:hypothetical protein